MSSPVPIIDSHIHLYPKSEAPSHAWYSPESPLATQNSVDEYRAATSSAPQLSGFIYIEADRKNDDSNDWSEPLNELAWMRRIIEGQPKDGEGHTADDAKLCLGIIPWAPLASGLPKLKEYLATVESQAGEATWAKVKGFRYLLQDKPNKTGLTEEFIDGLKLLGEKGWVFDAGVDQHRRGRVQLEELVEIIDRAHEGVEEEDKKVVFIINHLCKPDLTIVNQADPSFLAWRSAMFTLGKCSRIYMKLSGLFEEMPDSLKTRSAEEIFSAILPWLAVVIAAFGPERIMFGSNWPVCTVGVGEEAWAKWHKVVDMMCDMAGLSQENQTSIWSGTAKKAYNLEG